MRHYPKQVDETTPDEARRDIDKPIGGHSPYEQSESPITPQNMGETAMSGHQPSPEVDSDTLQEAQDEVDLYGNFGDNFEGEIDLAGQIEAAEEGRKEETEV